MYQEFQSCEYDTCIPFNQWMNETIMIKVQGVLYL